MAKKRDRRFPISLPLLTEFKLVIASHVKHTTKTGQAEAIVINALGEQFNWKGILKEFKQEAALKQISAEELIKEVLRNEKLDEAINVEGVDWAILLEEDEEIGEE